MIEPLIQYGGAIYWLLLLFSILVTTLYAERRESLAAPILCGLATIIFVFGFTTYEPDPTTFGMGVAAYLIFGACFAVAKWATLVYKIRDFVATMSFSETSDYELRHLAHQVFMPMNADDAMTLPPDPYEFRTRIMLWFLFWPSFTVFRCFAHALRWVNRRVWMFLNHLSKSMYDN